VASTRAERQAEVRLRVLRLLSDNPSASTRQIADKVGISNGAAYYCVRALVDRGLVKLGNFAASEHKGRYAYLITPRGIREKGRLTRDFLARKVEEYNALKDEIAELEREAAEAEAN
jgi:EPS-associated MarR family transcriptional regulator